MDGVSAAASIITLLGMGGKLIRISTNLSNAAQTIESTNETLRYIKTELEHLVPVFKFAGSVVQNWQPSTRILHANQQDKDDQTQPQEFNSECEALCKGLRRLAEERKAKRFDKVWQFISRDEKRSAQLHVLRSRLESIKATLSLSMTAIHLQISQRSQVQDTNSLSQGAESHIQHLTQEFSSWVEQQEKAHERLHKALEKAHSKSQQEDSLSFTSNVQSSTQANENQVTITDGVASPAARRNSESFATVRSSMDDEDRTPNLSYSPVSVLYTSSQAHIDEHEDVSIQMTGDQSRELVPVETDNTGTETVCPTCQGSPKTCDCHFRRWAKEKLYPPVAYQHTVTISEQDLLAYVYRYSSGLTYRDRVQGAGWAVIAVLDTTFIYIDVLAKTSEKLSFSAKPILELEESQATVPGWSRVENKFGRVYYQHEDTGLITYQHPSMSKDIDQNTGHPTDRFTRVLDTRLSLNDSMSPCQLSRRLFSEDPQTGQIRYSCDQWGEVMGMIYSSPNQNRYATLPRRVLSRRANAKYEEWVEERSKWYRSNRGGSQASVAMDDSSQASMEMEDDSQQNASEEDDSEQTATEEDGSRPSTPGEDATASRDGGPHAGRITRNDLWSIGVAIGTSALKSALGVSRT